MQDDICRRPVGDGSPRISWLERAESQITSSRSVCCGLCAENWFELSETDERLTLKALTFMQRRRCRIGVGVLVVLVAVIVGVWARSATSVGLAPTAALSVDVRSPGPEFAVGAIGLSTEARELSGGHPSAGHPSLIRIMRLLGHSVLRIGANSVDSSWSTVPRNRHPPGRPPRSRRPTWPRCVDCWPRPGGRCCSGSISVTSTLRARLMRFATHGISLAPIFSVSRLETSLMTLGVGRSVFVRRITE